MQNTISGGTGNDTIYIDTYSGVIDKPSVIQYATGDGKDVIQNYSPEAAIIHITSGTLKKVASNKKSPQDLVFTVGNGSVTIKDGVGKKVALMDADGNLSTRTYGATLATVFDSDVTTGGTFDVSADASVMAVDASARTLDIAIIGNAKANTLISGSGNDTLTGGKGKDTFVYSGGDDVIIDYKAGEDTIKFEGVSITNTEVQNNDVILTTNLGSLTIKNGIKKNGKGTVTGDKLTITDADSITTAQKSHCKCL